MNRMARCFLLAAAVLLAVACDPLTMTDRGKAFQGEYLLTTVSDYGSWTERYTISDSQVKYESGVDEKSLSLVYVGEIKKTVFDRFNGEEKLPASNFSENAVFAQFGYMILQYYKCDNEGTGKAGQYNVFRFAQDEAGKWIFTQGYKNGSAEEGVYINRLFETASEAEKEITAKNNYFAYASVGFQKK